MATTRTEVSDQRKTGLTLYDLEAFCAQARVAGATGSELIDGSVKYTGKITRVAVTVLKDMKATTEDIR